MAQESSYDFPVISEREDTEAGAEPSQPDKTKAWEEVVYEESGENWREGDRGPAIGSVMLREYGLKDTKRVRVRAWFVFDDGDTVEYAGLVPGNGTWKGKSRFGFRGGTGKFADRGGELNVDSTNPKRWG